MESVGCSWSVSGTPTPTVAVVGIDVVGLKVAVADSEVVVGAFPTSFPGFLEADGSDGSSLFCCLGRHSGQVE